MRKLFGQILLLIFWFFSQEAFSHPPYYTQIESLSGLTDQSMEMKLLHGDGIFFADPMRAVIVDGKGNLLAASPMSMAILIVCGKPEEGSERCIAYDELRHLVFTPDMPKLYASELFEVSGKPQKYPDYQMEEYGFKVRNASVFEILKYEALSIIVSPYLTGIALIWWLVIGLLICPLFWGLKENNWRLKTFSLKAVLFVFARLICTFLLLILAGYGWLQEPYSLPYLVFVSLSGAATALFITKPRLTASENIGL